MSLTIALQNTSDTNQSITLFNSGGLGSASFITTNSSFTAQSQNIPAPNGTPSSQVVNVGGEFYYDSVFNPSTGYYFGSVGTTLGFTATINGSSYNYITAIPSVANRTFDDIQTFLTNILRNDGTNPRPNAQVVLSISIENGISFLNGLVLDTIQSNESVVYNTISLFYNATAIGVGGSNPIASAYYNQLYTAAPGQPSPTFYPIGSPNTTIADEDGWFILQGNNLTSPSTCTFIFDDRYLQGVFPTAGTQAFYFEFQLTEVLNTGNFALLNYPSLSLISAITSNTLAVTSQSGITPNGTAISIVNSLTQSPAWNGQLKVRIRPLTGAQSPQGTKSISLLNQTNSGATYLSTNPNILGRVSSNGVGLTEILNSTIGNSYKVTSLYIWSANPNQLIQNITYGTIDANGNIAETSLDVVIDPFAQNQIAYRTNAMDNFIIDSNAIIQFTLLAQSSVNMKFEYDKVGFDELKLIDMGLGDLLAIQQAEKEALDISMGTPGADSDFTDFYATQ
jgi:hypothetical protein